MIILHKPYRLIYAHVVKVLQKEETNGGYDGDLRDFKIMKLYPSHDQ